MHQDTFYYPDPQSPLLRYEWNKPTDQKPKYTQSEKVPC